jgi:hypothetical protein
VICFASGMATSVFHGFVVGAWPKSTTKAKFF